HAADLHAIEIEAFTDDPHAAGATSVDHGVLDPQSHGPAGVDSVAARMGELDDAVADDDVGPGHPDPTDEVDPVEHLARTELQRVAAEVEQGEVGRVGARGQAGRDGGEARVRRRCGR